MKVDQATGLCGGVLVASAENAPWLASFAMLGSRPRAIRSFTNELVTDFNYFRDDELRGDGFSDSPELTFDRMVLMREAFVEWKPYYHPQYGAIEIGGTKKNFGRVPPGFLLPEECHRNMAFTLYHAMQLPKLAIDEAVVTPLAGGLKRVRVTVANESIIPTRLAQDVEKNITPSDRSTLSGGGLSIVSSGTLSDRFGPGRGVPGGFSTWNKRRRRLRASATLCLIPA